MKTEEFSKDLVLRELDYAMKLLDSTQLTNEAPWVYIKGLLAQSKEEQARSLSTNVKRWHIVDFPELKTWCLSLIEEKENRFAIAVLIDFATAEGEKQKAIEYLMKLKEIDRLRENYYQWRINKLSEALS